ncbi:MAG: SH3 domain-containing protein [Anaerolineae bacterium]
MRRNGLQLFLGILAFTAALAYLFAPPARTVVLAQQPTGSIPTVTGTPRGAYITVNLDQDQINVRAGPSSYFYPKIGVLLAGQQAPALGRSPGGDWIQIEYPGVPGSVGWVYAPLVSLSAAAPLPIVEPPPTPTPASTATIDPTLAAAFIIPETPTRLPTFTQSPPLVVPTFPSEDANVTGVPLGFLVFGFGFLGGLGAMISFMRSR